MNYQLLVLDIDGTVTNSKKEVTERTKQALHRLQESGVKVVLASGRPTCGVLPIAKEIELEQFGGFILSYNGANIMNCKTREVLYQAVLSSDCTKRLYDFSKAQGINILSYEGDCIFTEEVEDPYVQIEASVNKMACKQVEDFVKHATFPLTKCLMLADGKRLAEVEPEAIKCFGEELSVYRSEPFFLEIMPKDIDKGNCLGWLLDYLGLTREQMVACGDGYNDLSMIEFAGLGVAMENAQSVVKVVADVITGSNDQDGVAQVIETYFENC